MVEQIQTVTSGLSQTSAGEYVRAGSANRLPLRARLAAIALTAPGMAVLLAACGGDDGIGKTYIGGEQATQTASADNAADATATTQKVIEVPVTPTATTKPTEIPPTPTPEVKILTPVQIQQSVEAAISSSNISAERAGFIRTNMKNAVERTPKLESDKSLWNMVLSDWSAAGQNLTGAACEDMQNPKLKEALMSHAAFSRQLVFRFISEQSAPPNAWSVFYAATYLSPAAKVPGCKLPYLDQFSPATK